MTKKTFSKKPAKKITVKKPKKMTSSITTEILRFESVHPSIYGIYELIEHLDDPLAQSIREHVVNIEDSFVNSQEWTLSRGVPTLHLGLLGSPSSLKSTLVHRYLTGQYCLDESVEGGRFKKSLSLNNTSYLLLIRDEGSCPTLQFTHWLDVLILVAHSKEDLTTALAYASLINNYKPLTTLKIMLIQTSNNPQITMEFKKIPHNLFIQVNVLTGHNVDQAFISACNLATNKSTKSTIKQIPKETIFKQGNVLKKSFKLKKWKKKFLILTEQKLSYYDNVKSYYDNVEAKKSKKFVDLLHSNVKSSGDKNFTMTTIEKILEFEVSNKVERDSWIDSIEKQIFASLKFGSYSNGFDELSILDMNSFCADCRGDVDVTWLSINFGVLLCIGCSGLHRSLGSHVSKIRSLMLDHLGKTTIKIARLLNGNKNANSKIYERNLSQKIIQQNSSAEEKCHFIRRKYEHLEFMGNFIVTKEMVFESLKKNDFSSFLRQILRIEKFLLFSFVLEFLDCIFRHGDDLDGDERKAWTQIVVWNCEEIGEAEKGKIKKLLLLESMGDVMGGGF